ncbi:hypothetical protein OXV30_37890, partial [Burkholderia contaminans]|nr:hypothetical protein [Burkholderia contaminans]
AGIDASLNSEGKRIDFSGDISAGKKAWKDVWSAGQGLGAIERSSSVAELVRQLECEYLEMLKTEREQAGALLGRWRGASV